MAPASKQKAKLIPSIEHQPTKTLQDLTQDIKGIVEDILAKNLDSTPTPISDERSVPIARPKTSDDIRELTEDARDQIYHLMRPIERIFGSEALEPERKAPKRFLQYREKIQQLNNACQRCHRIVEKFETQAPEHAEWTIDALYNWVVRCSKEFKDFIEDYSEIIKEDQGKLYLEWNKIANKSSATMPEIEKNTVDRFPTKGQYWRTKYLKSLGEEEPAWPSGRLLRLEPNEIYMAQEDFEDIKLPRQMEAINTKIQMLNIDGSPAKTKNGTKVMKYLIDMKSEYREKLSNKRNYEEDEETNSNHVTRSRPRKS
ncbi:unnamed protein product [Sphagnum balticum]